MPRPRKTAVENKDSEPELKLDVVKPNARPVKTLALDSDDESEPVDCLPVVVSKANKHGNVQPVMDQKACDIENARRASKRRKYVKCSPVLPDQHYKPKSRRSKK